jgi:uncharacterized damage-inducible protein DinB
MSGPERWLRGPVSGVPPLLQPVGHSLLQSREEVADVLAALTLEQVHLRPGRAASIAYHVRHAAGSLDRLFTYARGESLSPDQLRALAAEEHADTAETMATLVAGFDRAVDRALEQLNATDERMLTEARDVGRKRLPSTVVGLLFHAAEHTQRHIGQAVTTAKIVTMRNPDSGHG